MVSAKAERVVLRPFLHLKMEETGIRRWAVGEREAVARLKPGRFSRDIQPSEDLLGLKPVLF